MMASYPFSVHMATHITMVLIVPALVMLGLPESVARWVARFRCPAALSWCAGVGAMAFWHIPAIFDAAAAHPALHMTELMSLVAAGIVFWWPILSPLKSQRMQPVPQSVVYLVSACFACTAMGILITFSPVLRYPTSGGLKDQQIGGLLMWVPGCLIYLTAVMGMFARWYLDESEAQWT